MISVNHCIMDEFINLTVLHQDIQYLTGSQEMVQHVARLRHLLCVLTKLCIKTPSGLQALAVMMLQSMTKNSVKK